MENTREKLLQFVLKELAEIKSGIETDRFTMENIDALVRKLNTGPNRPVGH